MEVAFTFTFRFLPAHGIGNICKESGQQFAETVEVGAFKCVYYIKCPVTRILLGLQITVGHKGETMVEVANGGSAALGEHEIAFKNNITLDAALVETIYNNVIYDDANLTALHLKYTNLAIANDVVVTKINDTKFMLTGNGKSIYVEYAASGVINTDGTKLVSGINIISSACELAKKSGNAGLGVVYLTGSQSYAIKNAADSFRMTLTSGSSLNVNGNCNATITTESGSTVTIGKDGSLTNASSVLNNGTTINNDKMKTIAANVMNNQVFASISEWSSSVPAASKVNNITINALVQSL